VLSVQKAMTVGLKKNWNFVLSYQSSSSSSLKRSASPRFFKAHKIWLFSFLTASYERKYYRVVKTEMTFLCRNSSIAVSSKKVIQKMKITRWIVASFHFIWTCRIINNYSPKWRWIIVLIYTIPLHYWYLDTKLPGCTKLCLFSEKWGT